MTEQITPAAVIAPTPAPVAVAPVAAPAPAVSAPAPVLEAAPVIAPAPEPVVAPAPAETTLLGAEPLKAAPAEAPKLEEVKKDAPVEALKAPEPTKETAPQSAEPAQVPTYESFKLPEGFTLGEKGLGDFTGILGELELAKGDHAKTQELGQKLVDSHYSALQTTLKAQTEFYLKTFEKQKSDWKEAFVKDQEIGGNRQETTLAAAKEFINTHGGTVAQQQEFIDLMNSSGIGNHPAMIRMLAKANIALREGHPLPATKPESAPTSKVEKRYGKMN